MTIHTYDPGEVEVILGPEIIFGLANGVMVRVEFNQPRFQPYYGTQGEASRAAVRDRSATVTVRTASTSPQNDLLDLLTRVDHVTADFPVPILIRDGSGRALYAGAEAYLKQDPQREFGAEVTELEWQFEVVEMFAFHGGN